MLSMPHDGMSAARRGRAAQTRLRFFALDFRHYRRATIPGQAFSRHTSSPRHAHTGTMKARERAKSLSRLIEYAYRNDGRRPRHIRQR